MNSHTGESYEQIADTYADTVDARPMNVYYERPGLCSLLPPLAGLRVLDVGCGSGWYAEYLLAQGAQVTAFDYNAEFVARTQARVGTRAQVFQADLAQPLTFAADAQFDVLVCPLVLHYVENWELMLAELARVLKPGGRLIFSTHHPFMDWQLFQTDSYFGTELLEDTWDIGKVQFYRRPLTAISAALHGAGFVIERLLEPQPAAALAQVRPELYERLSREPWFLFVRAIRQP